MNEYRIATMKILLEELASQKTADEISLENGDELFDPYDFSGGNVDHAYCQGVEDGEIKMARKVLHHLNRK